MNTSSLSPKDLMDQARRALREERFDDAQAFLINIVAVTPRDDEAWLLLAQTFKDEEKKRECLERARLLNPRNPAITRALGQSLKQSPILIGQQEVRKRGNAPANTPPPAPNKAIILAQDTKPPVSASAPVTPPASTTAARPVATQTKPASAPFNEADASSDVLPAIVEPLLDYGELMAQAIVMTTEPEDALNIGSELVRILDQVAERDPAQTRNWARAAGRAALLKYEKALNTLIANLPRGDAQLSDLLNQRQRALNYLR